MRKKRRMQVSQDNGKTWKWRWIDTMEFDPKFSVLQEGDLVKVNWNIHKVEIVEGKIKCSLIPAVAG